ncbi:hypothetical protein Btru_011836 [Bulinus truncatus]|nr:hypothetical protein Btru_011836 [Bulinus truncatus]
MVPLGVVISTLGSSNTHIFSGSRIVFSAARDGNLPELLSYIQVNHLTTLSAMVFTLPIVVPIMMLLMNLYMFVAPLAINPSLDYVYVALAVFGGSAILYIAFIYFKLSPPYFDKFVTFYQLITQACPPTK